MSKIFGRWKIDTVFVLIIFSLFTASAALVLIFGGHIYKNIVEESEEGYDERICLSYIWTKVKSADEAGRVYAGDFYGLSALYFEEEHSGVTYQTTIYLYDGWVRELFCEKGLEFVPGDGTPLIKAETLAFEYLDESLLRVTVNSGSLLISLRCKTGAVFT